MVPAGAHRGEIATGEADIAQQVIVELHQVGKDPLAFCATEHGRQAESHFSHLVSLGGAGSGGAGLCPPGDECLMNRLALERFQEKLQIFPVRRRAKPTLAGLAAEPGLLLPEIFAGQPDIGQQAVFDLLVGRAGTQVVGQQQQFRDHVGFLGWGAGSSGVAA